MDNEKIRITVCIGGICYMKGSQEILNRFRVLIDKEGIDEKIDLLATFCMSQCYKEGIGVKIDDMYYNIMKDEAESFFYEKVLPMVR